MFLELFRSIASCTAFYNSQCEWAKSKNDVMDLFYLCTEKWMSVSTEVQDPNFKPPEPDKEFSAKSESAMVLNKINSSASHIFVFFRSFNYRN